MAFLRIAVLFACIIGSTSFEDEDTEIDEVSFLQQTLETEKAKVKHKVDDDLAPSDYGVANSLSCESKEKSKTEDTPVATPPAAPEKQTGSTGEITDIVKLVLQLMTLWLVYDGLKRWKQDGAKANKAMPKEVQVADWSRMVSAAHSGDENSFDECVAGRSVQMRSDAWGCTPLHFAAVGGSGAIAKKLLDARAELDALDAVDETPLHIAARSGHVAVCEFLLKAGAAINMVNKEGKTPLVVAGEANQESTCRLLSDNGGGAGNLKDEELPPLVVSQVLRKVLR